MSKTLRLLNKKQVRDLVCYSNVHIGRLESEGLFPKRVILRRNRHGRPSRIGYVEHEVLAWIEAKAAERDAP
jgi:prophage regulatory protein